MRRLRDWLFQGDISDLNLFKLDEFRERFQGALVINVGSTNFLPPKMYAIHAEMNDAETMDANDWDRIWDVLYLAVSHVRRGHKVVVTCDMGLSRSVVFAMMLIAMVEYRLFDNALLEEIQLFPYSVLDGLFKRAQQMMDSWGVSRL